MPNKVKYNPDGTENALFRGNWAIDTSPANTGGGPSNVTGFYNGADAPEGGYVLYEEGKVRTLTSDEELINYINSKSGEVEINTVADALNWNSDQGDNLLLNKNNVSSNLDLELITKDGLIVNIDTGNPASYPGTGTSWLDLSGNGNNATLINSPLFSSNYDGVFLFDNTNDYFTVTGVPTGYNWSAFIWFFYDGQTQFQIRGHRTFFATNTFRYQWDDNSSTTTGRGPFAGFNANSGGINYGTMGGPLTPATLFGQWHCVGMTSDGTTVRNYMDGVEVSYLNSQKLFSTNGILRIGIDGISGIGSSDWLYEIGGLTYIGPFMSYNRALSSAEVLQNFNTQKSRFGL